MAHVGFRVVHHHGAGFLDDLHFGSVHTVSYTHLDVYKRQAQGCDLYFCEAVLALRERYQEVTVEAAIPCPTQADAWPEAERDRYRELVARCDMETMVSDTYSSTCMQRRDRYMVDHAMLLIAAFDGTAGGTRYTVEYALRRGIEIVDVSIPTE